MSTFRAYINSVLGTYVPVTDASGVIPSGFAGVDWSFIFAGVLLCLVVFCVFKVIGAMICKIF